MTRIVKIKGLKRINQQKRTNMNDAADRARNEHFKPNMKTSSGSAEPKIHKNEHCGGEREKCISRNVSRNYKFGS